MTVYEEKRTKQCGVVDRELDLESDNLGSNRASATSYLCELGQTTSHSGNSVSSFIKLINCSLRPLPFLSLKSNDHLST